MFQDAFKNWMFPTITVLICIENAFLLYNADALEVERHLFFTNVLIQFTGLFVTVFILDILFVSDVVKNISIIAPKLFNRKHTIRK